jgi:hypothetical protein
VTVLRRLAALLHEEGGLLADATTLPDPHTPDPARYGPLAGAGPRAEGNEEEYELLVEAVREGYLLHYAEPRIVTGAEPDLALLAGDRLYALGLAKLADLGDLEAVGELADVIALCALAHAETDPALADAVWEAGAVAVGWGAPPGHAEAKAAARARAAGAAEALLAAARESAAKVAPGR